MFNKINVKWGGGGGGGGGQMTHQVVRDFFWHYTISEVLVPTEASSIARLKMR